MTEETHQSTPACRLRLSIELLIGSLSSRSCTRGFGLSLNCLRIVLSVGMTYCSSEILANRRWTATSVRLDFVKNSTIPKQRRKARMKISVSIVSLKNESAARRYLPEGRFQRPSACLQILDEYPSRKTHLERGRQWTLPVARKRKCPASLRILVLCR